MVQSSSVFAEGIGDPTKVRRGSRSRGGFSRGHSGGFGGGGFRTSGLDSASTREKIEDIIKTEVRVKPEPKTIPDEDELNDVLDCEEESDKEDDDGAGGGLLDFDEDEPVLLPLANCKICRI